MADSETYWVMLNCSEPIPGLEHGDSKEPIKDYFDEAIFENEEHGDKCVSAWFQFGYPLTRVDRFNRKIRYRISPNIITAIRFWKPFTYELEARKPVTKNRNRK